MSHDTELSLKYAHFALFFAVLFYNIYLVSIGFLSAFIASRWENIENIDRNHYIELRHAYHQLPPSGRSGRDYRNLLTLLRYHDLRRQFLASNNLPKNFLVSKYLKKCLMSTLIELAEIRYYTYFATVFVLLVFFMYDSVREWFTNDFHFGATWISLAIALTGLAACGCVGLKISSIYWTIVTSDFFETGQEGDIYHGGYQIDLFWLHDPNKMKHVYQLGE